MRNIAGSNPISDDTFYQRRSPRILYQFMFTVPLVPIKVLSCKYVKGKYGEERENPFDGVISVLIHETTTHLLLRS